MDQMTLITPVPAGLILIAVLVGFGLGLALGGLAQRELDRALRMIAARRAVQATGTAVESEQTAHPTTPDIRELGMPYRRAG